MRDDLAERAERLLERLGIPEPRRGSILARFEAGRETFEAYNHLTIPPDQLAAMGDEELDDFANYRILIPWSQAYHSTLVKGEPIGLAEEDADASLNVALVEAFLDFTAIVDSLDGPNGVPTHLTEGESGGSHARTGDVRHRNDDARAGRGGFAAEGR